MRIRIKTNETHIFLNTYLWDFYYDDGVFSLQKKRIQRIFRIPIFARAGYEKILWYSESPDEIPRHFYFEYPLRISAPCLRIHLKIRYRRYLHAIWEYLPREYFASIEFHEWWGDFSRAVGFPQNILLTLLIINHDRLFHITITVWCY